MEWLTDMLQGKAKVRSLRQPVRWIAHPLLSATVMVLAAAYTVDSAGLDSLEFNSRRDWNNDWEFRVGTLEIANNGTVRPLFVRKNINASLNAEDFVTEKDRAGVIVRLGGILGVGSDSNGARAANILDGLERTVWRPDPRDELKTWWIEVDLGRVVTANKVVLKMGQGTPLQQFAVYTSNGHEAFFSGSKVKDYRLVGRTTQPNREAVIEYPLLDKDVVDGEEVIRQMVRFVFIELTAESDTPGQLAELEVHSLGDNLMLGALDRLGSVLKARAGEAVDGIKVADGRIKSHEDLRTDIFNWRHNGWMRIDLGSTYWLDTIRLVGQRLSHSGGLARPVVGYRLFVSDGSRQAGTGTDPVLQDFIWQTVAAIDQNPEQQIIFENTFSLRPVRHIFFSNRNNEVSDRTSGVQVNMAEIQAFGEGFVPSASLTSRMINLGSSRNITSLAWKADTPAGTAVEIRTRTGDTIEEITTHFCRNGLECTKRDWDKEVSLFKSSGPVIVQQMPDQSWSGWSRPYAFSGERFLSPSPKARLLIEARLVSQGPTIAPTLRGITLFHADPLARELTAFIEPRVVPLATPTDFSITIQPTFFGGQSGFDQVLVATPLQSELLAVHVGDQTFEPGELDSVYTSPDSLWLDLPVHVRVQQPPTVVIDFRTTIFDDNTLFETVVIDSRDAEQGQPVEASFAGATIVRLIESSGLLPEVAVNPPVFTPNGDGANDEVRIEFLVNRLNSVRPVTVDIFDVAGRLVVELDAREIHDRTGKSGRYVAVWQGLDSSGRLLPPGIYLCRVDVDAQQDPETALRTVGIAY